MTCVLVIYYLFVVDINVMIFYSLGCFISVGEIYYYYYWCILCITEKNEVASFGPEPYILVLENKNKMNFLFAPKP